MYGKTTLVKLDCGPREAGRRTADLRLMMDDVRRTTSNRSKTVDKRVEDDN